MSRKEVDRLEVVRRVLEKRLSQVKATELIGLSTRQVRRLCTAYEQLGQRRWHRESATDRAIADYRPSWSCERRQSCVSCMSTSDRRWRKKS